MITIHLGWWMLPLAITGLALAIAIARAVAAPVDIGGAITAVTGFIGAAFIILIAWLIWAVLV